LIKLAQTYKIPLLLALLLLTGFLLRLRLSQDACLHKWDERYHALVAKHLSDHPLKPTLYEDPALGYDYRNWAGNHIWLHKQPLPLWLIAASYSAFGISEFATRLPSLVFSTLIILVTFLLGRHFFDEKTGLLAAFFMAINGLVIEIGSGRIATDHFDILFLCFIEIAVLFAAYNARRGHLFYALLSGAFLGFAILTKWLPALIVLPIHLLLLLKEGHPRRRIALHTGLSFLAALLISVPWQVYILQQFPDEARWEYYHHWLHIATPLDGQPDDGWFHYLNTIRIKFSEIIYIPLAYLLYRLYRSGWRDLKFLALSVWIFIPILFFSFARTKMSGYILFICPALFLVTADFFFVLKDGLLPAVRKPLLRGLSILFLAAVILLPLRYCFERTLFGLGAPRTDPHSERYKSLSFPAGEKTVVLNVAEPIEFMFYHECSAYAATELHETETKRLREQGYRILFLDASGTRLEELQDH
jgi:4-amino-4-deoxy-L-arabinose transferase-like glycosyltransferase